MRLLAIAALWVVASLGVVSPAAPAIEPTAAIRVQVQSSYGDSDDSWFALTITEQRLVVQGADGFERTLTKKEWTDLCTAAVRLLNSEVQLAEPGSKVLFFARVQADGRDITVSIAQRESRDSADTEKIRNLLRETERLLGLREGLFQEAISKVVRQHVI